MSDTDDRTELDQTKMGAAVIGLCIAQILGEEDPRLIRRLHDRAQIWYEQLAGRGNTQAAEMLYMFARALEGSAESSGSDSPESD